MTDNVSATTPDWSRERPRGFWDPSRKLLKSVRDYQRIAAQKDPLSKIRKGLIALRHGFWSIATAADIPLKCAFIEGGLMIPHPTGVVIHPDAVIGPNCLLMQQVTLGVTHRPGAPKLGGHVDIGAGARVLGAITVGDHTRIGANAVVVKDLPDRVLAVGVPAEIVKS